MENITLQIKTNNYNMTEFVLISLVVYVFVFLFALIITRKEFKRIMSDDEKEWSLTGSSKNYFRLIAVISGVITIAIMFFYAALYK